MKKLQLLNFPLFNIFEENPHINSFPFPTETKNSKFDQSHWKKNPIEIHKRKFLLMDP